jgi:transcription antitermination factor NusG
MPWYVIHTKSRHEYKVNTRLIEKNFKTFLPEMEAWSKQKDRKKKILVPLFPGYVFTQTNSLNNEVKLSILKTVGVVRMLGSKDNSDPVPVPDEKIDAIRRFLSTKTKIFTLQYPGEGEHAQIIDGPFSGIDGKVVKCDVEKELFVVSIELLKRSVAIRLKGFQIRKISS